MDENYNNKRCFDIGEIRIEDLAYYGVGLLYVRYG